MLDYQRIVDDIRGLTYSVSAIPTAALKDAAEPYVQACMEINARLRRCGQLLRQGLRSEAIQEAEMPPGLLDVVAVLDFPELPQWKTLLAHAGLPGPPALLLEVAVDLNAAYAQLQPLESLLRQHRLLALRRAPLAQRLGALRQIARLDPQNTLWQDDIVAYEKTRLRQIDAHVRVAADKGDVSALADLKAELGLRDWKIAPPADLISLAARRHEAAAKNAARQDLQSLEPQLNEAFGRMDVAEARPLCDRWHQCAAIADLPNDDPLVDRAASALAWMAREDALAAASAEHMQTIDQLALALDDDASEEELADMWASLSRFDEPPPVELERQYQAAVAVHQRRRFRRKAIVSAAVFAVVVLMAAGVYAAVNHYRYRQTALGLAREIDALVNEQRLSDATASYDRSTTQQPSFANEVEVAEAKDRLDAALKKDAARRQRLDEILARAERSADDTPLAEALPLAVNEPERQRIHQLRTQISEANRKAQELRDRDFDQRWKTLTDRMARLEAGGGTEEERNDAGLERLVNEAQALHGSFRLADTARAKKAAQARQRADGIAVQIRQRREQMRQKTEISKHVAHSERFRAALQQFLDQHPDSDAGREIRATLAESALWEGHEQWSRFLARPEFARLARLTPDEAASLLAAAPLLTAHPQGPLADAYREKASLIAAIKARTGDAGPLVGKLDVVLRYAFVAQVTMLETKDGKRYYGPKTSVESASGQQVQFECFTGTRLTTRQANILKTNIAVEGRAPQSIVADAANQRIRSLKSSEWDQALYDVLLLVDDAKTIHPVLKLLMLRHVANVARTGSASLAVVLKEHEVLIDPAVDLTVKWVDPDDGDARAARIKAEGILEKLPSIRSLNDKFATERAKLNAPLAAAPKWVGWLARNARNEWRCMHPPEIKIDGELAVLAPVTGKTPQFVAVGTASGGNIAWNDSSASARVEGRPLYVLPKQEFKPNKKQ